VEDWIRPGLMSADDSTQSQIKSLLDHKEVPARIQTDIDLTKLTLGESQNLFSALFHGGYVTAVNRSGRTFIRIPNDEVHQEFDKVYAPDVDPDKFKIDHPFIQALLQGNLVQLNLEVSRLLVLSSLDTTREMSYAMWFHGLLDMALGESGYLISGNPESGHGRPDIFILPPILVPSSAKNTTAWILEVKRLDDKDRKLNEEQIHRGLDALADLALKQIEENKYFVSLNQAHYRHISEVILYGVACYGKHIRFKMDKRLRKHLS